MAAAFFVNTAAENEQTPFEDTSSESSLSSISLPEACLADDKDDSSARLARKQRRGLEELQDKKESKCEHIKEKFAHRRDHTRQYYEGQRLLAETWYNKGVGFLTLRLLFSCYLRRELANIYEKERNGMVVLFEGERIERGLVNRKYHYQEADYIRLCRKEWEKKCPAARFWHDEEKAPCSDDSTGSSASPRSFV
ncbi:hypothetical protein LX36DRAFT_197646 [Colletotrichum falcatum]|nr:hypothetical protein LX36DRAFT_197646 [Colletotrichum falcatum]